ncbi:hypothetical protein [Micromonospora sp. NPDC006431]|uniref:hypothetical protein n=1 Tax=Micromonospora sp. NPDC006431 TaxID=3364235 RepID=UPI00368B73C6
MAYSTTRTEPTRRRGRHAAVSVWNQPTQLLQQLHQRSRQGPPRVVVAVIVLLAISVTMIVAILAR